MGKNARIKFYRRYKKWASVVDDMHREGKIDDATRETFQLICESSYAEWRRQLRESRKPFLGRPGRPKTNIDRNELHATCKRPGCAKPSATGQVYCSRSCSPLGAYGRNWLRRR